MDWIAERTAQRTLEEHRRLFGFVAELERHVEREARGADARSWAAELSSYLSELHGSLSTHFAFEESSQFWDELALLFPYAARRISRLVSEHDQLLSTLSSLVLLAREAGARAESGLAPLKGRVQEFVKQLRRHEAEEDELIQSLYSDDLGIGD